MNQEYHQTIICRCIIVYCCNTNFFISKMIFYPLNLPEFLNVNIHFYCLYHCYIHDILYVEHYCYDIHNLYDYMQFQTHSHPWYTHSKIWLSKYAKNTYFVSRLYYCIQLDCHQCISNTAHNHRQNIIVRNKRAVAKTRC